MTMRTRQNALPKPDELGRIRPSVGRVEGGAQQPRFTVGTRATSVSEAERRLSLIRRLYERQCEKHRTSSWQQWTLRVAHKIAAGQPVLDTCIGENPTHTAGVVSALQEWGIPVVVTRPDIIRQGKAEIREDITELVSQLVAEELAKQQQQRGPVAQEVVAPVDPLSLAETKTLHEAIDAYCEHLRTTGKQDAKGRLVTRVYKCCERLGKLKKHHTDTKLRNLDNPTIDSLFAVWRNRPNTQKGNRCSRVHAVDMLKEFDRLLRFVDKSADFRWTLPPHYHEISKSPVKLPSDSPNTVFQTITKETYTPEELSEILRHTDELGRALIALCVNCAFGQSEIGQWPTSKYQFNTAHPHAKRLGIDPTASDSWIVGERPKTSHNPTGNYGEHLLWPQVARAVAPLLDGREVLPITGSGTWWYRGGSSNPGSKFYKWWSDLIKRVQKQKEGFRYLPFGSLRDTLPDLLTAKYDGGGKLASLALQHQTPGEDRLLDCYANLPFAQLFKATCELKTYFKPMLDEL